MLATRVVGLLLALAATSVSRFQGAATAPVVFDRAEATAAFDKARDFAISPAAMRADTEFLVTIQQTRAPGAWRVSRGPSGTFRTEGTLSSPALKAAIPIAAVGDGTDVWVSSVTPGQRPVVHVAGQHDLAPLDARVRGVLFFLPLDRQLEEIARAAELERLEPSPDGLVLVFKARSPKATESLLGDAESARVVIDASTGRAIAVELPAAASGTAMSLRYRSFSAAAADDPAPFRWQSPEGAKVIDLRKGRDEAASRPSATSSRVSPPPANSKPASSTRPSRE